MAVSKYLNYLNIKKGKRKEREKKRCKSQNYIRNVILEAESI